MLLRFRAGLIHLLISTVLALAVIGLVFFVWYPQPLHSAVGVTRIFFIVLGVDVVIGPLLTTVVYRKGKKSLYFDLSVIALLQSLAFAYGLWTVAEGRPVWLVYNVNRFDLVQAYQVAEQKADEVDVTYRSPSWWGPRWVSAQIPEQVEQRNSVLFESVFTGVDIAQKPEFYHPLYDEIESIRKHAKPFEELSRYNPQPAVTDVHLRWPEADAFLPMMAKTQAVTVLINKKTAKIISIVNLNPWD